MEVLGATVEARSSASLFASFPLLPWRRLLLVLSILSMELGLLSNAQSSGMLSLRHGGTYQSLFRHAPFILCILDWPFLFVPLRRLLQH